MDAEVLEIAWLTFRVSSSATLAASLIAIPAGAALAIAPKVVRAAVTPVLTTLMGLPPVVVGLMLYFLFSRSGPLGAAGFLYTPVAMGVAQTVLIVPIIAALTKDCVQTYLSHSEDQLRSLGASSGRLLMTALFQIRFNLVVAVLAGAGRAFAEVGAVLMVGGNIENETRVLTTSIATETGKGNLVFAMELGVTLMAMVLAINLMATSIRRLALKRYGL